MKATTTLPLRIPSKNFRLYRLSTKICSQTRQKASRPSSLLWQKGYNVLGDHWIGIRTLWKYFKEIGLDGVVGSSWRWSNFKTYI